MYFIFEHFPEIWSPIIFGFRIRSQHEAAKWIFYLVHFKYYVEISSPKADVDKPVPKLRWQRKVKAV
jgi:hypothetical protein